MFRPAAIVAAACLFAVPAGAAGVQTPEERAEREAAAHRLMDPMVDEMTTEMLVPLWEDLSSIPVEADERAALRTAFDKELVLINRELKDRLADIVGRHVPLAEITPAMDSPGWEAATEELDAVASGWAMARGVEMGARVIENGCAARPKPSAGCVAALAHVARYRSGELTVDEIVAD